MDGGRGRFGAWRRRGPASAVSGTARRRWAVPVTGGDGGQRPPCPGRPAGAGVVVGPPGRGDRAATAPRRGRACGRSPARPMPRRIARWRERREPAERAQAGRAQHSGGGEVGREQPVEAVGQADHQAGIGLPPALVADQHLAAAEILPGARASTRTSASAATSRTPRLKPLGMDRVDRHARRRRPARSVARPAAGARWALKRMARRAGRRARAAPSSSPICSSERREQRQRRSCRAGAARPARARPR